MKVIAVSNDIYTSKSVKNRLKKSKDQEDIYFSEICGKYNTLLKILRNTWTMRIGLKTEKILWDVAKLIINRAAKIISD